MKKLKKLCVCLLSEIFAFSFVACAKTPTSTSESSSSSVEVEEEPTELAPYDDKGAYDAIIDKTQYNWSDSENLLNGAFSNGETVKSYATLSQAVLDDGSVSGAYYSTTEKPNITYITGADLITDSSIDASIRSGLKGSHDDDAVMAGIAENNFIKIVNEKKKTLQLTVKPQCTLQEFEEADYIAFKIAIYNESTGETAANTETVYFKNRPLMRLFRCTWYEVKIPLDMWRDVGDKSAYADKAALFGSLNDEVVSGDRSKGLCLQIAAPKSDGSTANNYTAYISDFTLGVEKIEASLGRNIANLSETAVFNDKTCTTNTFIYWGETEKVRRTDESDVSRSIIKYSMPDHDGGNIAVIPQKKLAQIQQYDYIYVTMYIETENPFPFEVGINGSYHVTDKKANTLIKGIPNNPVLVSANKWITYKIPIKGVVEKFYARLKVNRVYTATNIPYVYYQNSMPLFYINGEYIHTQDAEAKTQTYGFDLYISRIFLVKE